MTVRATARGPERYSLEGTSVDVLICGASFAGLATARELAGAGASVLIVDRYAVGERATSEAAQAVGAEGSGERLRALRCCLCVRCHGETFQICQTCHSGASLARRSFLRLTSPERSSRRRPASSKRRFWWSVSGIICASLTRSPCLSTATKVR